MLLKCGGKSLAINELFFEQPATGSVIFIFCFFLGLFVVFSSSSALERSDLYKALGIFPRASDKESKKINLEL